MFSDEVNNELRKRIIQNPNKKYWMEMLEEEMKNMGATEQEKPLIRASFESLFNRAVSYGT